MSIKINHELFVQRLCELMSKNKITTYKLAEVTNLSAATISRYMSKGMYPKIPTIETIARYFSVNPVWLMGYDVPMCEPENSNPHEITDNEFLHIKKYRELDAHGKEVVDLLLDVEHRRIALNSSESEGENEEDSFPDNVIELNFSEQPSSAGTGYWLDEEQMIKKKVMLNRDTAKADFCVPVSGDSMTPQFNDGDILLVRKQPAVDIGQIGIFTIDGTGFVKKFGIGQLESLNSKYEPIPINEDTDLICNGKVLGVLNPEWIVED